MEEQRQVKETPQLLETSLRDFAKQLEDLEDCPDLRKAQKECPDIANDESFHLMFLRTELFDVKLAAERYVKYWENRVTLWGDKAFQELTLDDDATAISYGFIGSVKGQDRVIYMRPGVIPKDRDIHSACRVAIFTTLQALRNSTEMQQKGALVLMDFHGVTGYDKEFYDTYHRLAGDGFPLRVSLVGLVRPLPLMGIVVDIIKLMLKPKIRNRVKVIRNDDKLAKHSGVESIKSLLGRIQGPL